MDISEFVESGWFGFAVALFVGAVLILSLALGYGRHSGSRMRPFGQAWKLVQVLIFWYIVRQFISPSLLRTAPITLLVPGIDLALAVAIVWATIRELSLTFTPDWTWRSGARMIIFFLPPVMTAFPLYTDLTTLPAKGWVLWGAEAFVMLPFVLRLAYSPQQEFGLPNTQNQTPKTAGDRL